MKHALKIERLEMKVETANEIVKELGDFLEALGFPSKRISELECRSRDGFIPHGHNMGGVEAVAFSDQESVIGSGGTGFPKSDATLEKYRDMDIEQFEKSFSVPYADWSEEQREEFDESRMSDSEATVLYSVDAMLTSETELNLRICISVKDAPYHRKYDDLISIDLEFKSIAGLKKKLKSALKRKDVSGFSRLLSDAY